MPNIEKKPEGRPSNENREDFFNETLNSFNEKYNDYPDFYIKSILQRKENVISTVSRSGGGSWALTIDGRFGEVSHENHSIKEFKEAEVPEKVLSRFSSNIILIPEFKEFEGWKENEFIKEIKNNFEVVKFKFKNPNYFKKWLEQNKGQGLEKKGKIEIKEEKEKEENKKNSYEKYLESAYQESLKKFYETNKDIEECLINYFLKEEKGTISTVSRSGGGSWALTIDGRFGEVSHENHSIKEFKEAEVPVDLIAEFPRNVSQYDNDKEDFKVYNNITFDKVKKRFGKDIELVKNNFKKVKEFIKKEKEKKKKKNEEDEALFS